MEIQLIVFVLALPAILHVAIIFFFSIILKFVRCSINILEMFYSLYFARKTFIATK